MFLKKFVIDFLVLYKLLRGAECRFCFAAWVSNLHIAAGVLALCLII